MTTRRHKKEEDDDEPRKLDTSSMLWRGIATLLLITICPFTRPWFGLPSDSQQSQQQSQTQSALARIEQRVDTMSDDVKQLGRRMSVVEIAIEGAKKGFRL